MMIHRTSIIVLLGLGGCATQAESPQVAQQSVPCAAVAAARARDAGINGYDADRQKIIYEGAYKDCLKWSDQAVYNDYGNH